MSDTCENAVSCDCQPVFQVEPPDPPPPPIIYWNTQQCATATCETGLAGAAVQVCIAANLYSSTVSQADADGQAYAVALAQAKAGLNCGLPGQLQGLRWEMPCTNGANPCSCVNPADHQVVAAGTIGQTYLVSVRIRGVVECKNYANSGVGGTASGHLFTCTNPTQAIPAAGADPANEYALVISNPPATYFLNRLLAGISPTVSEVVDFNFNFQVTTGALVTLKARAIDALQYKNVSNLVANNAPPAVGIAEPFNGQFLEMIVTGIF